MKNSTRSGKFPGGSSQPLAAALILGIVLVTQAGADSPLSALKTLRVLPKPNPKLPRRGERSRGQACEHLRAGEALEITSFIPEFVGDRLFGKQDLPVPTSRRATCSVCTDMDDEDRADLPLLTQGKNPGVSGIALRLR